MTLIDYQCARGGKMVFKDIAAPSKTEWESPSQAVEAALAMEKDMNGALLAMHELAGESKDPHAADFIEGAFLGEQVKRIKYLGDLATRVKRVGEGLGEVHIDQELLE